MFTYLCLIKTFASFIYSKMQYEMQPQLQEQLLGSETQNERTNDKQRKKEVIRDDDD